MPHILFPTAFGVCGLAWNDTGLSGFQLPEAADARARQHLTWKSGAKPLGGAPPEWVQRIVTRVQRHFEGKLQDFADTPLDWSRVSAFQQTVYRQAQAIKPGFKSTYGQIADALALGPEGPRDVGVALASNPWPLVVPCHRVVGAKGKMTGFSAPGGVRTKTRLLALEGAELLSE
ncbi:MAG: methylated-DNA--[protein]-cysteine S-methyltransferase [Verrucomicrobia bacterium]|nr:methylated-DNA--[protein]-cysteine S-methyltransferase [Verrucomicrobiota bacterium]